MFAKVTRQAEKNFGQKKKTRGNAQLQERRTGEEEKKNDASLPGNRTPVFRGLAKVFFALADERRKS